MSLYLSHPDIPAFHPEHYRKPRPSRFDDFRPFTPAVFIAASTQSNPTYQQFIDGDFVLDDAQLTA